MRTSILTRLWRELQSSRIAVAYYIVSMLVQVRDPLLRHLAMSK